MTSATYQPNRKRRLFLRYASGLGVGLCAHVKRAGGATTPSSRSGGRSLIVEPWSASTRSVVSDPGLILQRLVESAAPGDRILIKDGYYTVDKLIIKQGNVTLAAFPGHRPELRFRTDNEYSLLIGQGADNVTVEGLILTRDADAAGYVMGLGGRGAIVRDCRVSIAAHDNAMKYDCVKILADGATVEGCEIHGAPNQGIDAVARSDLVLRRNRIHDCANAIVIKGGCQNVLIEENYCFNLKHGAIGIGGTTDPRWQSPSYPSTEAQDVIVRKNVVYYDNPYGIGGGIFMMGARTALVHHNTIVGGGIHVRNGGEPSRLEKRSTNNTVISNIIVATGDDGILVVDAGNDSGLAIRGNIYWKIPAATGEFKIDGRWKNYADYLKHFRFDEHSLMTDPRFNDAAALDFRLRPDSQCIGNGRAADGVRDGTDIGALPSV